MAMDKKRLHQLATDWGDLTITVADIAVKNGISESTVRRIARVRLGLPPRQPRAADRADIVAVRDEIAAASA